MRAKKLNVIRYYVFFRLKYINKMYQLKKLLFLIKKNDLRDVNHNFNVVYFRSHEFDLNRIKFF